MNERTVVSGCRKYRYVLHREIGREDRSLCFICLNPSTADEKNDDPTVTRCRGFASDLGYGNLYIVNLFAWRATDPKILLEEPGSRIGPHCDRYIDECVAACDMTIAAWGTVNRKLLWRAREISGRCDSLRALKITKKGHPAHPLYLRKKLTPVSFPGYL